MYVYDMPCRDLYATNVSMFEQLQCNPFYIAGKYSNMEMHFSIPIHADTRYSPFYVAWACKTNVGAGKCKSVRQRLSQVGRCNELT